MEQDKMDKHIQEKLNSRTIEPSRDLWNRIEDNLEQEKPKKNNRYWYAAVAVAVVLLVLFNSVDTGNVSKEQPVQEVVNEENNEEKIQQSIERISIENDEVVQEALAVETDKEVIKQQQKNSVKPNKINKEQLVVEENTQIASVDIPKNLDTLNKQKEIITDTNLKVAVTEVLDDEIESLLKKAQNNINSDELLQKNIRINATALLLDVETELESPFKDKVLKAIRKGVRKAETVVVDRKKRN